jgi:hypothetical protein
MEALLQREGAAGLARRLVRNPQIWLAEYRDVPQDKQFERLRKLLLAAECSVKRPLVYREGVPSERVDPSWLVAQLKGRGSGWRLREDLNVTLRSSTAQDHYMSNRHPRVQSVLKRLGLPCA